MARTTATNFSGALQFPYATAATDVFHKEDVQTLAQAVDQHDHTTGKGVSVPISTNTSLLANGGFEIWQRGNGPFTTLGAFAGDRWIVNPAGTDTFSVSRDGTNQDTGSQYCAAVTFTLGTGAGGSNIFQSVLYTDAGLQQLAGRTVTASVRVRTATANAVRMNFQGTNSAFHPGGGVYQTLSVTATMPATVGSYLQIYFAASCTAYLDNAMLVVGSQAANYVPLHPADDLARCQRYYEIVGDAFGYPYLSAWQAASGSWVQSQPYHVGKAVTPTVTKNGTWTTANCGQPSSFAATQHGMSLLLTATATGYAAAYPGAAGQNITIEANP